MSHTGNLEGDGVGYINVKWDRVAITDPEKAIELKRRLTPEMKERFNRPAKVAIEPFTRYWFNKGIEGGSPPTPDTFQRIGLSRLFTIALDTFNRGSVASDSASSALEQIIHEQIITNVIVQNAPALAQDILAASNSASAHEQIIVNVIVQDAPALAQRIFAALPGANCGNQRIITNVIVQNAPALAQRIVAALPGANGGNLMPKVANEDVETSLERLIQALRTSKEEAEMKAKKETEMKAEKEEGTIKEDSSKEEAEAAEDKNLEEEITNGKS